MSYEQKEHLNQNNKNFDRLTRACSGIGILRETASCLMNFAYFMDDETQVSSRLYTFFRKLALSSPLVTRGSNSAFQLRLIFNATVFTGFQLKQTFASHQRV
jgi:hypothetical protein